MATRADVGWVIAATLAAGLDNVALTTAMPELSRELGVTMSAATWVINAYVIPFACCMLAAAGLGRVLGVERAFRCGVVLFGFSSVACALAPTLPALITARAVQGFSAALIVPLAMTVLVTGQPQAKVAERTGWIAAIQGISGILGPVVGGAIVTVGDWRAIFWLNAPLCLAALGLAAMRQPVRADRAAGQQIPVFVCGALGLAALVYAALTASESDAPLGVALLAAAAGAVLLYLFFQLDRRTQDPFITNEMKRSGPFKRALLAMLIITGCLFGAVYILLQYLQEVRGYSALGAGAASLPWTLLSAPAALLAARVAQRIGIPAAVRVGAGLMATGLVLIAIAILVDATYPLFVPGLVASGLGTGLFFGLSTGQALHLVSQRSLSEASSVIGSLREVGVLVGAAFSASLLAWVSTGQDDASGLAQATPVTVLLCALAAAVAAIIVPPEGAGSPQQRTA